MSSEITREGAEKGGEYELAKCLRSNYSFRLLSLVLQPESSKMQ